MKVSEAGPVRRRRDRRHSRPPSHGLGHPEQKDAVGFAADAVVILKCRFSAVELHGGFRIETGKLERSRLPPRGQDRYRRQAGVLHRLAQDMHVVLADHIAGLCQPLGYPSMTLPGLTSGLGNSIVATSMTVLAADGSSVTPMIFSRISCAIRSALSTAARSSSLPKQIVTSSRRTG